MQVTTAPQGLFEPRHWALAQGRSLTLGPSGLLMGILNVTPDSFSDGGELTSIDDASARARGFLSQGASILDVGGESTRPGADPIDATTEQARILPVFAKLRAALPNALLSVDTYRAGTAEKAVAAGAHIVNDVSGLQREPDIAHVAAAAGAGLCIMHTGRGRKKREDVIADQVAFFERSLEIAAKAGVRSEQIVIDPGFGFAKDERENFALMARIGELHSIGFPILAGTSRKRFIGHATERPTTERAVGTAATTALLRAAGVAVFRVHDVAINRDALAIADAMIAQQR
ncbi:dihydropteroate synthase [Oricola cellulosilytica]|uniref:Dihydropteroate synthase n=1 Tax=Oricola cellulosilytica TaxID=1429082 RepID=A0A4R0PA90_9HYPH|nr:dihydropteroate synthase [Oricola cellulosilytica]TCD11785.1 dihydropteroate synthase [Oricola cellulosilytica]